MIGEFRAENGSVGSGVIQDGLGARVSQAIAMRSIRGFLAGRDSVFR